MPYDVNHLVTIGELKQTAQVFKLESDKALKSLSVSGRTISYSFLDMSTLVDTYTVKSGDSAKVLTIAGYEVELKISATAGNIITANSDGIYATNRLASFTQGNIVTSDANGAPQDGAIPASTILVDSDVATMAEINEMLTEVGFTVPNNN